jgi:CRISPR-associated protein Csx17
VRLLADILERRLVDAEGQPESGKPVPPLLATHFCRVSALNRFAMRQIDPAAVTALLPSLSLLEWQKESETTEHLGKEAPSNEFLVQGYFRPLVLARSILLTKGANSIEPDAARARVLVKMIRAGMWSQAFHLSEQVYRSCGIEVVRAPDVSASGDWIAACLLIPVTASVTRTTFKWWMVARKKGKR